MIKRLLATVPAITLALLALTACTDQRAEDCRANGGFTRDSSQWNPSFGTDGKFHMTYITIRYCFTDGKIVDIWQA